MIRQSVFQSQRMLTILAVSTTLMLAACTKNSSDDYELAKESMAKAETPTAIIHLKTALQKDPNRWEARALLGQALMRTGNASGALIELEKAYAAKFNEDKVVPALAAALLQTGKPQALIDRFSKAKMQTPAAKASLQASLGVAYWQLGQKQEAEAAVAQALEAVPTQSNALLLKANIAASKGDVDGAISLMDQLLQRDPKDLQALLLLAQLQHNGKGNPAAAEKTLLKAVEVEPRFVDAHKALLLYRLELKDIEGSKKRLAEVRKVAPTHSITYYLTALVAYAESDMPKAREALQPLLKSGDDIGSLQVLAGMIEFKANSLLKAETHLAKGLQLLPDAVQPRLALADLYLRRGQADKSLAALSPLLERQPENAQVLGAAADVYMQLGDTAKAEAFYDMAARLAPDNTRTRVALASARIARGGTEEGLRELEALSKLTEPDAIYAEMAIFNARLRTGDLDGALLAAEAMISKQPKQATPWILKAGIFERKGDAISAKSALERSVQIDPTNFRAASRLADYDAHAGQLDAAIKRFAAIIKADPHHTGARLALVDFNRRSGSKPDTLTSMLDAIVRDDPDSVSARIGLIDELQRQGQLAKALEAAQTATAALPNQPRVLGALGDAQFRSGNLEQAAGTFRKLGNLNPKDPYAHFRLAEVQLRAGQRTAAMAALKHSLVLKPDYLPAQRALAAILLRAGDPAAALRLARSIQSQRPKDDIGYLLEGDIEAARKNWSLAGNAYRAALDRRASGEAASKLHQLTIASGNAAAAALFATTWHKAHPDDVQFISYLSEQALADGKYAEAESLLRNLLERLPNRASAWSNLAYTLAAQKRPGALEAAGKAVKLAPDNPSHHQMLARAQAAEGKMTDALLSQRDAIRLSGNMPSFRLGLAKLLIQSGDKGAAKAELQSLAGIKDQFLGKDEITGLLKDL